MTDRNGSPNTTTANPLSDDYVNAVIQRHGYQCPETVIARLNQWIGLHGGEDSVTLLMYEAHKALSKLRADGVPSAQPAFWIDLEPISGSQNLLIRQRQNLGALGPGKHTLFLSPAADQASAPVADADELSLEAQEHGHRRYEQGFAAGWGQCAASVPVAWEAPSDMPTPVWWINYGLHGQVTLRQDEADRARIAGAAVYHYHAAPQASEAVRDAPSVCDSEVMREAAWHACRKDVGTGGWTVAEAFHYRGFFMHGWRAALSAQPGAKKGGSDAG